MPGRMTLLTTAVAAALVAGHAAPARADLLAACSQEVSRFCSDVVQGRGRIAACLASHRDQLGPGCLPEVETMAQHWTMPVEARRVLSPGFRAALPAACETAAAHFCPGVPQGDGRVFACLYARGNRVGAACTSAARAAIGR